ncbi:MAG: DPP IV N-terminal domain-containing protein, partial [Acidobacteria bacterium]|nr:DPP IV N-terminal domain-containing protein [Acidobacteriota bacterium]
MRILLSLILAVAALAEKADITAEQAAREEAAWMGLIPDLVGWSPDGGKFYYHAGNNKPHHPDENAIFEVAREGGKPRRLSAEERLKLPPLAALAPTPEPRNFSRDHKLFVYERDGDVFLVEASGQTRRLTNTETPETNAHFSHDDRYVLFESGQNLFGWTIGTGELRQFTRFRTGRDPERKAETAGQKFLEKQQTELFGIVRDQEAEKEQRKKDEAASSGRPVEPYFLSADQTVSRMELSPDGRQATFLLIDRARAAEVIYQRPVTKSGFTEPATTRPKVGDPTSTVKMGILTIADGKVKWVNTEKYKRPVTLAGPWWSPDGKHAVIKVVAGDFKDLWIEKLDCETGQSKPLFQDHDDAWVPLFPPAPVRWMPDSRAIYLTSERDGYRHLYRADLEGKVRQLTRGRFDLWYEAPAPAVSLDGKRI